MRQNTTVVITGASSGIGRATAELFVKKGYRVIGGVRQRSRVAAIPGVELVTLDVRNEESVSACIETVLGQNGSIDVLINNAGYSLLGAIEEASIDEAKAIFDTNFFGVLRTVKAVLPSMRNNRSGMIINISSVLGFLPGPYMGLYTASKHAVEGYSETLDHEVRPFGIRVVLVEPGFTRTNIDTNAARSRLSLPGYEGQRQRVLKIIGEKIESAPSPETVANVVLGAVEGKHRMRFPVGSEPKLLSRLRKWMPPALVDRSIRKEFHLDP